ASSDEALSPSGMPPIQPPLPVGCRQSNPLSLWERVGVRATAEGYAPPVPMLVVGVDNAGGPSHCVRDCCTRITFWIQLAENSPLWQSTHEATDRIARPSMDS
ncbi:MAG: hypothetical protein ACP5M0_08395, partial [Desulfomonilaceae bacterium]